jgi:ferredoxin
MPHVIMTEECISCGACETECPEDAIMESDEGYLIDPERCQDCGACAIVCPQECIVGPESEGDEDEGKRDNSDEGHESEYE